MYKAFFSDQARRELKKNDKYTALFIVAWVRKNLEGCSDPRIFGKSLSANRSGQWRYRIGDYRLIAEIADGTVTILILNGRIPLEITAGNDCFHSEYNQERIIKSIASIKAGKGVCTIRS